VLIGERINPVDKEKLADALKAGSPEIISKEALVRVQAGAAIRDARVDTFGVDEVTLRPRAIQAVMGSVDVPLCLDVLTLSGGRATLTPSPM
jgi:cobalamin-dependent methionine synthase I